MLSGNSLIQSIFIVKKIQEFVKRWHIDAEIPQDMSLSLGSFGISLTELTKGYAVFPNGGKAVRLRNITSITDRTGKKYPLPAADEGWKVSAPDSETSSETSSSGLVGYA
jgi:penicillin-binding protein 1A